MKKFVKEIRQASSQAAYLKICQKFKAQLNQKIPATLSPDYDQTLLHLAASVDNAKLAAALIAAGANIAAADREGRTPIYRAVANSSAKVLRCLLKAGACTTATDQYGTSPLHLAVQRSFVTGVKLLIAAKADVRARAHDGTEPIHYLGAGTLIDIHELLCADVAKDVLGDAQQDNQAQSHNRTALSWRRAAYQCLQLLLENGANINATDQAGSNVLQRNIVFCDPLVTKKLIESGMLINHANQQGETALHILLDGLLCDTTTRNLKMLLAHGAKVNLKDKNGLSPLEVLERNPRIPARWRKALIKILQAN